MSAVKAWLNKYLFRLYRHKTKPSELYFVVKTHWSHTGSHALDVFSLKDGDIKTIYLYKVINEDIEWLTASINY